VAGSQANVNWEFARIRNSDFSPTYEPIATGLNQALSPDGQRLATLSEPLTVKVFDVETGQETLSLKGGIGRGLAFSPDGNLLAGAAGEAVMNWDAAPLTASP